jgi:hypothetical protein
VEGHRRFGQPRAGHTGADIGLKCLDLGASAAALPRAARTRSIPGAHLQPRTESSPWCHERHTDATPSAAQALGPESTVSATEGMFLTGRRMRLSQLDAAPDLTGVQGGD